MVSLREHVQAQLERIAERNEELNLLLFVRDEAELIEEADLIDARIADGSAGALAGCTIAVKANINVIGLPITAASKTLESYMGTYDADVIQRIKAEDGLIIGIANCDEFASGSSGMHSAFGPSRNPHDPARITGGSSSGSAAAVAAGFCDAALGTDTGGSVRNPASHCGVVAIKPSYGRVSRHGVIDLSMSLDQVGPIGRDVDTAARLLEAIAGYSKNDATTHDVPVDLSERKVRFGVLDLAELDVDPDIMAAFDARVSELETEHGAFPRISIEHIGLAVATYYPLVYTEFFSGTRRFDGRRYGLPIDEVAGDEVKRRILGGKMIAHAEDEHQFYRKSLAIKERIAKSFDAAFGSVDAILSPVVPRIPRRLDEDVAPEDEYAEDAITIPANLAGICAASVPMSSVHGLPIGIQVLAPRLREDLLVSAMRILER